VSLRRFLLFVTVVLLISGCLKLREEIRLNWDGSGVATIRYQVPLQVAAKRFGAKSMRKGKVPLTANEFLAEMPHRKELEVIRAEMRDEGELRIIDATIKFKDVAHLDQNDLEFSLTGPTYNRLLTLKVKKRKGMRKDLAKNGPLAPRLEQMLAENLRDASFDFIFEVPGKPFKVKNGKIKGNIVTFSMPTMQYLVDSEEVVYSVRFNKGLWHRIKSFFLGPEAE
jgi:hypothetical protein